MRAQNLLCCATLAFVNNRIGITCGGKRNKLAHAIDGQTQSQLILSKSNGRNCYGSDSSDNNSLEYSQHDRRAFVQTLSTSFLASMLLMNAKPASAACLSGDIRAECIGIYKLPIDASESRYVGTPELLKVNAPDMHWVPPIEYPPTYADAVKQLKDQRQQLDVAQDLISRGQIENTGLAFLDIVPKVTAAGLVIIKLYNQKANEERNLAMKRMDEITSNDGNPSSTPKVIALETKAYRIDDALNELIGSLGGIDILIGQGIRGDLGALTPAQIEILSSIADCRKEFDTLLKVVPEEFSMS